MPKETHPMKIQSKNRKITYLTVVKNTKFHSCKPSLNLGFT